MVAASARLLERSAKCLLNLPNGLLPGDAPYPTTGDRCCRPPERPRHGRAARARIETVAGRLPRAAIGALWGAGAAAGLAWRRLFRAPLPQTRGTLRMNGLLDGISIGRDRFGVPRIEARSDEDLAFGIGFCQ